MWGRKENGPQFTLAGKAWADIGLADQGSSRTPFHLGDLESTRKLLLDAGFSKVLAWYSVRSAISYNPENTFGLQLI